MSILGDLLRHFDDAIEWPHDGDDEPVDDLGMPAPLLLEPLSG